MVTANAGEAMQGELERLEKGLWWVDGGHKLDRCGEGGEQWGEFGDGVEQWEEEGEEIWSEIWIGNCSSELKFAEHFSCSCEWVVSFVDSPLSSNWAIVLMGKSLCCMVQWLSGLDAPVGHNSESRIGCCIVLLSVERKSGGSCSTRSVSSLPSTSLAISSSCTTH